jgi:hypothetical protein
LKGNFVCFGFFFFHLQQGTNQDEEWDDDWDDDSETGSHAPQRVASGQNLQGDDFPQGLFPDPDLLACDRI